VATGGATGVLIGELLDQSGINWHAIPIRGRNRISLNVHERTTGLEYRFVPAGPTLEPDEWGAALEALAHADAEWIVASGSLPPGVPADFYARAAARASQRGQKFVLDTSGPALQAIGVTGMELLKLSLGELEFLVGRSLPDARSQEAEVVRLIEAGIACKIAVSLGENGALLGTLNGINRVRALKVKLHGAVGAGDSFLAGLVLGLARGLSDLQALTFANAAGAAAVTTFGTARVQRAEVEALYRDQFLD